MPPRNPLIGPSYRRPVAERLQADGQRLIAAELSPGWRLRGSATPIAEWCKLPYSATPRARVADLCARSAPPFWADRAQRTAGGELA